MWERGGSPLSAIKCHHHVADTPQTGGERATTDINLLLTFRRVSGCRWLPQHPGAPGQRAQPVLSVGGGWCGGKGEITLDDRQYSWYHSGLLPCVMRWHVCSGRHPGEQGVHMLPRFSLSSSQIMLFSNGLYVQHQGHLKCSCHHVGCLVMFDISILIFKYLWVYELIFWV